jgi:hypothetical protein
MTSNETLTCAHEQCTEGSCNEAFQVTSRRLCAANDERERNLIWDSIVTH